MVPAARLERVRSCLQGILSPWCLPFHHAGIWTFPCKTFYILPYRNGGEQLNLPVWWNGRHQGLKIPCWQQRARSSRVTGIPVGSIYLSPKRIAHFDFFAVWMGDPLFIGHFSYANRSSIVITLSELHLYSLFLIPNVVINVLWTALFLGIIL